MQATISTNSRVSRKPEADVIIITGVNRKHSLRSISSNFTSCTWNYAVPIDDRGVAVTTTGCVVVGDTPLQVLEVPLW